MIVIILDYEKAEERYISSKLSYADVAAEYNIPPRLLARYARDNEWVKKRKQFQAFSEVYLLDITKLARSSDALESIIENAFISVSESSADSREVDTKTLKDLTSALKEAINIKQNLFLLPMITEQKQLEFEQKRNSSDELAENEIRVILENDADKYCM